MHKTSLKWILFNLAFWGAAFAAAFGLFNFARDLTTCWRLTSLPGVPLQSCSNERVDVLGTPVIREGDPEIATPTSTPEPEVPAELEHPSWDGGSRINILFVGLRGGDPTEQDCPLCTDTLILLTVDPITKSAGMFSIPRDMWVNIPGYGYSRINTAWALGKGSKLPGGGTGLTMKTVSVEKERMWNKRWVMHILTFLNGFGMAQRKVQIAPRS